MVVIHVTWPIGIASRALSLGTATIEVHDDIGNIQNITLSNAYPDPGSPCNLVGLSSLRAAGAHRR
jgi:hypothetical protein